MKSRLIIQFLAIFFPLYEILVDKYFVTIAEIFKNLEELKEAEYNLRMFNHEPFFIMLSILFIFDSRKTASMQTLPK